MVFTSYTLKPSLENKQIIFSTSRSCIPLKKLDSAANRVVLFSTTAQRNLNHQPLRKGAFFCKLTDKKGSNCQTARL